MKKPQQRPSPIALREINKIRALLGMPPRPRDLSPDAAKALEEIADMFGAERRQR